MADSLEKQLLRATKDPSSYTKFINARRGGTGDLPRGRKQDSYYQLERPADRCKGFKGRDL